MIVLVRKPGADMQMIGLFENQVLADRDHGKAILFSTTREAEEYFELHSGGKSMQELNAYTRDATAAECECL